MTTDRTRVVRIALVGGPMYDPLYETIPAFERETGLSAEIVERLPHPELNAYVRKVFESGEADLDLISTHTKYAPSQAEWLRPIDDLVARDQIADALPRPLELSRMNGRLMQVPRNLDVRLLHYRRDLFDSPAEQRAFAAAFGRPLRAPATWTELIETAAFFTRPGLYGFLFPGRDSGLFGTFYELLVGAGGDLFDAALRPTLDSPAGVWAAGVLKELHHVRRVTPRDLRTWHYDEISASFREGCAAMVCDWPGSYHLYANAATCSVWDRVGLALLPEGPKGIRAAYAGCHSFAVPRAAKNIDGAAALLRFLTSADAQFLEADRGAIPCRASALDRIQKRDADEPRASERWSLLAAMQQCMIIPPRFAAYPDCEDAIWQSMQHAMEGSIGPAAAVRQAAATIQEILAARSAHQAAGQ